MDMGIPPSSYPRGLPHRAVYCSRTLNLRSIQACTKSLQTLLLLPLQQWNQHDLLMLCSTLAARSAQGDMMNLLEAHCNAFLALMHLSWCYPF